MTANTALAERRAVKSSLAGPEQSKINQSVNVRYWFDGRRRLRDKIMT